MSRPRVLTIYLDTWYGAGGQPPSSEMMQFGGGLFDQMGFDEVHISMEDWLADTGHAEKRAKSQYPYDWVFTVPFTEVLDLRELAREAPVVAWMSDCVWRYTGFGRYWKPVADFIVTTDKAGLARYGDKGILSNWACRPEWAQYAHRAFVAASFHGQMYGDRKARISAINAAGDVKVLGLDTASHLVDAAGYFGLMSDAIFSICLTNSSHGPPQMKSRLFEPQVVGSILVTEPVPQLEDYWSPGEECLVFHSPASAQEQMAALLADDARLTAMRDAARLRALNEHTYHHRFAAILATMGVPLPVPPATTAAPQEA